MKYMVKIEAHYTQWEEVEAANASEAEEIIDARIPVSSRNPDIDSICAGKPRLIVLNRADQADPAMNKRWTAFFKEQGYAVLETDAKTGKGINQFSNVIQGALKEQIAKDTEITKRYFKEWDLDNGVKRI